jgi:hypothetical protein
VVKFNYFIGKQYFKGGLGQLIGCSHLFYEFGISFHLVLIGAGHINSVPEAPLGKAGRD